MGPAENAGALQQDSGAMPPENPNSLSPDTYASIVAFLLKANGAQAGTDPLTPETAVTIALIATGRMPAGLTASPAGGPGRRGAGRGTNFRTRT
jgi:hypothetical protein